MAGMTFEVEITGLEKLIAKCSPALIRGPVAAFVKAAATEIEEQVTPLIPRATGNLQWSFRTQSLSETAALVGTRVTYAWYVEHGRGPGKMPPPDALAAWARTKGAYAGARSSISRKTRVQFKGAKKSQQSAGFVIARAIGRRGTRAQPFMAPGLAKAQPAIQAKLGELGRTIESEWGK